MSTRHINPEGLSRSPAFSQAVVVEQPAKMIYIGGQNGVDAAGKLVGPTVGEQASQAFRNLATVLESEGASLANIVSWSIAVVDGHSLDEGFAAFQQRGTRPTHGRRLRSTSSPAWAPSSSSRSTPSPSCDAAGGGAPGGGTIHRSSAAGAGGNLACFHVRRLPVLHEVREGSQCARCDPVQLVGDRRRPARQPSRRNLVRALVEVRRVAEAERRVPRLELLRALEEADDLAVLGIRGHPED
jgi:enamine deaminase RidA (YjgF/YER057c/UK114 family)